MPLERYHILQNEIDPCAVKVNSLEGTPLIQQRGAQDRLFMSSLGKARPGTAVKAIQTISWSQQTTGPHSGATAGGRPWTSPRKGRKEDTPQDTVGRGDPQNQAHQLSLSLGPNGAGLCARLGQGPWVACTSGIRAEIPHLDLSVLSSPGGRGRFQGRWARGASRTAAFGAHSHGYSSAGPFLVETSDFWPLGSWVQTRDGGAQLVGVL